MKLLNENPRNPKTSRNGMKTIKIGTTGNRLPKEGWKAYVAEGAYLAGRAATGGASTNCPLPPSLTHLQKGSKFGFFCITYSHLGKYSGKCYNILSRAVLQKSLEFVLPEDPQKHLKLDNIHWTPWNWFQSTRKGGQIKRSEKQSSCTYRGGCVAHEWLQAVIGRYYRGGRRAVVDQDI